MEISPGFEIADYNLDTSSVFLLQVDVGVYMLHDIYVWDLSFSRQMRRGVTSLKMEGAG
jgi:hypothetical protein